jgi:hypothetical protein
MGFVDTNVALTNRTNAVVVISIGPLIQSLKHENADVREQSAWWYLGNVAGDSKQEYRNHLLDEEGGGTSMISCE